MEATVEGLNTAVLAGTLSSDPREIVLASGARLLRLEVTTRCSADEAADTVPVAWFDPPASAPELRKGDAVVVAGKVRRRYFGGGGVARSATEVLAACVVPARRRAAARKAVETVAAQLQGAALA